MASCDYKYFTLEADALYLQLLLYRKENLERGTPRLLYRFWWILSSESEMAILYFDAVF